LNAFGFARKHSNPPLPLRGMVKEMIPCTLSVREVPIVAGEAAGRAIFRQEKRPALSSLCDHFVHCGETSSSSIAAMETSKPKQKFDGRDASDFHPLMVKHIFMVIGDEDGLCRMAGRTVGELKGLLSLRDLLDAGIVIPDLDQPGDACSLFDGKIGLIAIREEKKLFKVLFETFA